MAQTSYSGPLLYRADDPRSPMSGIPLEVADRAFGRKFNQIVLGNGSYGGPATGPSSAGGFTLTENGAAGSVALDANGKLVLTTSTTDESNENLQFLQVPYLYTATKRAWCFARLAASTAITTDVWFGMFESQTAIIAASAIAANDDSIGFFKAATATDYTFRVSKNGTATTQAMGLTLTDGASVVLGFTVGATGLIQAYAALDPNDAFLSGQALLGNGIAVSAANAPNTVNTFLSLVAGQEGGTTARTLTVPWAFFCAEHA